MEPRAGDVPFAEAIDYYRSKIDLPTERWTDLWEGMHARAFVVAGAQSEALVGDFHAAIDRALAEGTTLADFRQDFDAIVARHGWSYRGNRAWRSRVIFDTNLRMAYAAGRWAQMQEVAAARPYLRYVSIRDGRERPEHGDWHDTVLPIDHPWWSTHYPPNGWLCRCTVQQLSAEEVARRGLSVAPEPPPVDMVPRRIRTADGESTIHVPRGIDPGFGYNVGQAAWGAGAQTQAMERHGRWAPLHAPGAAPTDPGPLPVDRPRAGLGRRVPPGDEAALHEALRTALGGDERVLVDPLDARVMVGQGIADHMLADPARQDGREAFWPLIPELVEEPAEIWMGFARHPATGRVAVRRRYVRVVELDGRRTVGMVADADGHMWTGMTFFRGQPRSTRGLRHGLRIYRR